jgi:hypothetical protein
MTDPFRDPVAYAPIKLNYQAPQPRKTSIAAFIGLALLGATLTLGAAIGIILVLFLEANVLVGLLPLAILVITNVCIVRGTRNRGFLVGSLLSAGIIILLLGICAVATGVSPLSDGGHR